MINRIRKWYQGETKAYENDDDDPGVIIGVYTNYHWTATIVRYVVKFYMTHWKFIWSTGIAVASLTIAYLTFVQKTPSQPIARTSENEINIRSNKVHHQTSSSDEDVALSEQKYPIANLAITGNGLDLRIIVAKSETPYTGGVIESSLADQTIAIPLGQKLQIQVTGSLVSITADEALIEFIELIGGGRNTDLTFEPMNPEQRPEAIAASISIENIIRTLKDENLTDLQKKQFANRLDGESIVWDVVVEDVNHAGRV